MVPERILKLKTLSNIILGVTDIHGYTHDNSAAILSKGRILFAASEERYTRIKHDSAFPINAIRKGTNYLKLNPSSIHTVAVGYPKRTALSIFNNKYFYEIIFFIFNILVNRNIFLFKDLFSVTRLLYSKSKKNIEQPFLKDKRILYVDHHLSHASSAYYTSGFEKSLTIALDAFGTDDLGNIKSGAVFICDNGEMKKVMSIPLFASLGLFYQSVTYSLGFTPGDGEGKTMGLAAYGNPKKAYSTLRPFCPSIKNGVWSPSRDWLSGLIPSMPKIAYLFKFTNFGRTLDDLIKKYKKENVAAATQMILEKEILNLMNYLIKKYPEYSNISLAGGVFLNVKANKKIVELKGIRNVFVHPHAGDGGVAIGAAFAVTTKGILKHIIKTPLLSCALGESFTDTQILKELKQHSQKVRYNKKTNLIDYTVNQLLNGQVIGWFQGRAEWGPRALGFRSVLADPRNIQIKNRINDVLKNREYFMPFAPSVLEEKGNEYFKNFTPCPFMTTVFDVFPKKARLFPAALHIDTTARPNSVNATNNSLYCKLLKRFYKKTNLPILLNTSFNKHGLPIVNSPKDAIDHLLLGAVNELIIGNYSVKRNR